MRVPFFLILTLALWTGAAHAAEEVAFLKVWQAHLNAPQQHQDAIAACQTFVQEHPDDPLIVIANHLHAWHLLKLGRTQAASDLLTPMVRPGATGIDKAASDLARAWLTRLDRDAVKAALQSVYRHNVAYPEKLNVLWKDDASDGPPRTDRWDKRWTYRLVGFANMPGLRDQKYELQSILLGDRSDLTAALAMPYAKHFQMRATRLRRMTASSTVVEFEVGPTKQRALIAQGARTDRTLLAYIGQRIIVLADYTHWQILPKPR